VFRRHQREVYAYFLRMGTDAGAAEELTQETFVRACTAALRFRGDASVRTWLFGIAHRVLLEASRAGLFERVPPLEAVDRGESIDLDARIDVRRALASLGATDREALVMVDVLGFEPIEVSRSLSITPEAFRVRLHRARARLREAYG